MAALDREMSRIRNARVWNSRGSRFPSGVVRIRETGGWLRTGGSFHLSFKERWPLKGGNSSLSSRTWNRVKSFSSSLPLLRLHLSFSLLLSLSAFSLPSAFIPFAVSVIVSWSRRSDTNRATFSLLWHVSVIPGRCLRDSWIDCLPVVGWIFKFSQHSRYEI